LWGSDWAIGVSDRSRLIKTPDWISERPPRGGLSYLRSSFSDCLQMALSVISLHRKIRSLLGA
jgi:hypothetical protein